MTRRTQSVTVVMIAMFTMLSFAGMAVADEAVSRTTGKQLYQANCSGCHGDLEDSAKAGRSMNRIRTAIRIQPQHKQFESMPDEQLLLIALVLKDIKY
ncbi:MAG: c-type cytochrome [Nitrospirota bacterium]